LARGQPRKTCGRAICLLPLFDSALPIRPRMTLPGSKARSPGTARRRSTAPHQVRRLNPRDSSSWPTTGPACASFESLVLIIDCLADCPHANPPSFCILLSSGCAILSLPIRTARFACHENDSRFLFYNYPHRGDDPRAIFVSCSGHGICTSLDSLSARRGHGSRNCSRQSTASRNRLARLRTPLCAFLRQGISFREAPLS